MILRWLGMKQLQSKHNKRLRTYPHVCDDCGTYKKPLRRMSTIILGSYVLTAIAAGFFLSNYASWILCVIFGYLTLVVLISNQIRITKPECPSCFSTNVRLPHDEAEYRALVEKEKEKEKKRGSSPLKTAKAIK